MNTSQLVLKNWILWTHYYTRTETIGELENFGQWDIALVRMKISLQLQQFGIKNRMI